MTAKRKRRFRAIVPVPDRHYWVAIDGTAHPPEVAKRMGTRWYICGDEEYWPDARVTVLALIPKPRGRT